MQELSRGCSRNAEARGCSRRAGLRQEKALKMVTLSQRMLQNCHAKAGGCSRQAGAEAGGCSRNGGTEAGDDAVPQNHSGCPVPTVTCSPGWAQPVPIPSQAQPVSSPFRPAQDGWGQAGDTPESLRTHGQRPAPPGTPRLPSSGKRRQLPGVVQQKGRHQCHPQPPQGSPGPGWRWRARRDGPGRWPRVSAMRSGSGAH